MCDYSLEHVANAKASKGSKIVTSRFGSGVSPGFAFKDNPSVAACLLPGAEIAFAGPVQARSIVVEAAVDGVKKVIGVMPKEPQTVAKFVQVNQGVPLTHHDALQFATGEMIMLYQLAQGQEARVLQMPADPALKDRGGSEIRHREHEHA